MTREPALLKKLCAAVREGVNVENCCSLFSAVDALQEEEQGPPTEEEQGPPTEEENGPHAEEVEVPAPTSEYARIHPEFRFPSDPVRIPIHCEFRSTENSDPLRLDY